MMRLLLLLTTFAVSVSQAQDLHFLVPGGAGGGWDSTARGTGMVLRDAGLIDSASFENVSGAGGGKAIGMLIETADHQQETLMVNSTPIVVRSVTRLFPFSFRDLTPIARVIGDYQVLAVLTDGTTREPSSEMDPEPALAGTPADDTDTISVRRRSRSRTKSRA